MHRAGLLLIIRRISSV